MDSDPLRAFVDAVRRDGGPPFDFAIDGDARLAAAWAASNDPDAMRDVCGATVSAVAFLRQVAEEKHAALVARALMATAEGIAHFAEGQYKEGAAAITDAGPLTAAMTAGWAAIEAARRGEALALRAMHRAPTFAEAMARLTPKRTAVGIGI
jgi:hypothetical protein